MLKSVIIFSLVIICALATSGVDFSRFQGAPAQSVFTCFKQNGKDFFINQIWGGSAGVNHNFQGNWQKAKAAGIRYVDGYAFICNACAGNTASNICNSIKSNLPSGFDGMIWIDVEPCTGCWTGSAADRLNYVTGVANTCKSVGLKLGVYSGMGSWGGVFGSSSYDAGSLKSYPLWYSHYDGKASFSDWSGVRFGGWSSPAIKQYSGTTAFCGTSVDFSAY